MLTVSSELTDGSRSASCVSASAELTLAVQAAGEERSSPRVFYMKRRTPAVVFRRFPATVSLGGR